MLKFQNTLSGQLEEFQPLSEGVVKLYICGPTVWSFAHIGNFRTFVFGDVLRRFLKFKGYNLTHVFNLTDVDDRIINEAKKAGKTIDEFTAPFIAAFWEDADALGLERPEIAPRATQHINEMIAIIEKLLENGHAYESEGSIYYRISAFPDYGKLSKINFSGNISGASGRVDTDKYEKENAQDFALWKFVDADEPTGWDASFGRGRPGWHIEISRGNIRYSRRRNRFEISASRKRDCPIRRRDREALCKNVAAQRALNGRRKNHVEISRQLFHLPRPFGQRLYSNSNSVSAFVGAVSQTIEFHV
jgi:cysteinyl-tRNA synthetase